MPSGTRDTFIPPILVLLEFGSTDFNSNCVFVYLPISNKMSINSLSTANILPLSSFNVTGGTGVGDKRAACS